MHCPSEFFSGKRRTLWVFDRQRLGDNPSHEHTQNAWRNREFPPRPPNPRSFQQHLVVWAKTIVDFKNQSLK